ncbi:MAG TPA: YfjI family protein [Alphaproteobacteria bacterium]|nr:YfjI family protein [Alphaproteobacteria bacterium]
MSDQQIATTTTTSNAVAATTGHLPGVNENEQPGTMEGAPPLAAALEAKFGARLPDGDPIPLSKASEEPDRFPIDALGSMLGRATKGIADIVQASTAMTGTSVLASATLAVQAHADVKMPYGMTRPVSGLFVSAGVTGDRKSAVDDLATRAIQHCQDALWAQFEIEQERYEAALESAAKIGVAPPRAPRTPQFLMDDPNAEGIYRLLSEGRPSIGLFSDEGGRFLGGYAMSEDQRLKTATTLSLLWDGKPLSRVRGGERASFLPGRRFCANVMLQPYLLETVLGDKLLKEQGLLSRTLITAPASLMGYRLYRDPDPASEKAVDDYTNHLLRILAVPPRMRASSPHALDCRPLPLSPVAKARWIVFHDDVERRLTEDGELRPISGLAAKLPEHAVRIAGVLALVDDVGVAEIDAAHMEAGIELARHYGREARRLFSEVKVDPQVSLARKVGGWLADRVQANRSERLARSVAEAPGGDAVGECEDRLVTLEDIYQFGPKTARKAATARKMMDILERHRWVVRVPGTHEVRGKRESQLYYVVASGDR